MSRKLIYLMVVSGDGFVETPDRSLDWVTIDEEIHTFVNAQVRESVAIYGRRMYELMSAAWPPIGDDPAQPAYLREFSEIWKATPKVVFSKTLERVEWNSRLVRGDVVDEVSRLKREPGPDLFVGGATIASACAKAAAIDEYRLFVQPVAIGGGTPYFPQLDRQIQLTLVDHRRFANGVVYARYAAPT